MYLIVFLFFFFFLMIRRPPRSTLFLHDALPIWRRKSWSGARENWPTVTLRSGDRKSTRLNSSHANISYAVFCLKKKKTQNRIPNTKKKQIQTNTTQIKNTTP